MKTNTTTPRSFMQVRRTLLLLPLALLGARAFAETEGASTGVALPPGACPLNSGGPSLLGSKWRLLSIYGTKVPIELEINMEVGENQLTGFAGCNNYLAKFKRVGHTGFMMESVDKEGNAGCPILRPSVGAPTINVGDWQGSYIRTLQRAGSVQQDGNSLQFFNRSGESSVLFVRKYGDGTDGTSNDAPKDVPPADAPKDPPKDEKK